MILSYPSVTLFHRSLYQSLTYGDGTHRLLAELKKQSFSRLWVIKEGHFDTGSPSLFWHFSAREGNVTEFVLFVCLNWIHIHNLWYNPLQNEPFCIFFHVFVSYKKWQSFAHVRISLVLLCFSQQKDSSKYISHTSQSKNYSKPKNHSVSLTISELELNENKFPGTALILKNQYLIIIGALMEKIPSSCRFYHTLIASELGS